MLSGSDIPPPRGFVWVVAGLVVICVAIAFAIPWLWRVRARSGLGSMVVRTTTLGAATGLVLAALFATRGSGEPSVPSLRFVDYAIWFAVVTAVGAANGVLVGLVSSRLRPRCDRETPILRPPGP